MFEWLKALRRSVGQSVDDVTQTNLAPAIAATCVLAVVGIVVWHAINHPSTRTQPRPR